MARQAFIQEMPNETKILQDPHGFMCVMLTQDVLIAVSREKTRRNIPQHKFLEISSSHADIADCWCQISRQGKTMVSNLAFNQI